MLENTVNASELIQAGIGFTMRDDETGFYQCAKCALAQVKYDAALAADGHPSDCEGCEGCTFVAMDSHCENSDGKCGEIIGVFAYQGKDIEASQDARAQLIRAKALRRFFAEEAANVAGFWGADTRQAYRDERERQDNLTDIEVIELGTDVELPEYDGSDVYVNGACTMLAPTSEGGDIAVDDSDMTGEALSMAQATALGEQRSLLLPRPTMYLGGQADQWAHVADMHLAEMGECERDDNLDTRPLWDAAGKPQHGAEAGYWARVQRTKAERLRRLLCWVDEQARKGQTTKIRGAIAKWRTAYSEGVKASVPCKRRMRVRATRPYSTSIADQNGLVTVGADWSQQWLSRSQMDILEHAVKLALGIVQLPEMVLNPSALGLKLCKGSGYIRRGKRKPEAEPTPPLTMPAIGPRIKVKRIAARFAHHTANFTW